MEVGSVIIVSLKKRTFFYQHSTQKCRGYRIQPKIGVSERANYVKVSWVYWQVYRGVMLKRLIQFLSNRVIKIFAHLIKLLCYLFHGVYPHKRFLLPNKSPALFRSKKPYTIPLIIWQTNYTNSVTLPVYINYLFNRLLSPTCEYRFVSTEDRSHFIRSNFSKTISDHYERLQIGAAQADYWRLLVLYQCGGVYMDIDAHLVWPLHWLFNPDDSELFVEIKHHRLTNYFIASAAKNPHLMKIIDAVGDNIQENRLSNVYDITGPGVFDRVLAGESVKTAYYRYVCNQGNFTNEYFQYIDKPQGKWTKEQEKITVIRQQDRS